MAENQSTRGLVGDLLLAGVWITKVASLVANEAQPKLPLISLRRWCTPRKVWIPRQFTGSSVDGTGRTMSNFTGVVVNASDLVEEGGGDLGFLSEFLGSSELTGVTNDPLEDSQSLSELEGVVGTRSSTTAIPSMVGARPRKGR